MGERKERKEKETGQETRGEKKIKNKRKLGFHLYDISDSSILH